MNSDFKKSIKYWRESSSQDFKAAKALFDKKLYPHCLFFCHLSLEKLLKSFVMEKTGETAPYIHDLPRLAEIAEIKLDSEKLKILEEIFGFNIAGRYIEEKNEFYKKYNDKNIAEKYLKITNNLSIWLKKTYQKKQ